MYSNFREENGKAWISFKKKDHKGIRAHLKEVVYGGDGDQPYSVTAPEFSLQRATKKSFVLTFDDSDLVFKVVSPYATFNSIHTKSVSVV